MYELNLDFVSVGMWEKNVGTVFISTANVALGLKLKSSVKNLDVICGCVSAACLCISNAFRLLKSKDL